MARYIIDIDEKDVDRFEAQAGFRAGSYNEWTMSEGEVYPECDTRTFIEFDVIRRDDDV